MSALFPVSAKPSSPSGATSLNRFFAVRGQDCSSNAFVLQNPWSYINSPICRLGFSGVLELIFAFLYAIMVS